MLAVDVDNGDIAPGLILMNAAKRPAAAETSINGNEQTSTLRV